MLSETFVSHCSKGIDKSSSAELSKAINSFSILANPEQNSKYAYYGRCYQMWPYFQDSAVCYAYIEDVFLGSAESLLVDERFPVEELAMDFRRCKWFTRAWTLQELVARVRVIFYDVNWKRMGSRDDVGLLSISHDIIEIPDAVLATGGQEGLSRYSIAERTSWAATREPTRVEDEA